MKMQKILTTVSIILLFNIVVIAQAPNWTWATSGTGTGSESVSKVISDNNGNSIVSGGYTGSMTLGSTTVSTHANNAPLPFGKSDLFLAKYDASGNLLWVNYPTGIDTNWYSSISDIATDASGNIYAYMSLFPYSANAAVVFGNDTIRTEYSLVKFDPSGNILWHSDIAGNSLVVTLAVDNSGNVYLTAGFSGGWFTQQFDTLVVTNPHPLSNTEIITVKYNSSGHALWGKTAGGSGAEFSYKILSDNSANLYVVGSFSSDTMFFDSTTYLVNTAPSQFGPYDYFYSKYDSSGNFLWAKSIRYASIGLTGGTGVDYEAALNNQGELYLSGRNVSSNFTIGGSVTLTSPGYFVSKVDSNGEPLWASIIGDTLDSPPSDLQIDGFGNLYVLSSFISDSVKMGNTTLYNASPGTSTRDLFVAMYDANGLPIGAFNQGGDDNDLGVFYVNPNSSMLLSGSFRSNSLTLGSTTLTNPNFPNGHMFLTYSTPILTGLKESNGSDKVSVFPNPANNSIQLMGLSPNEKYTIAIFNMVGQKMQSQNISTAITTSLDIQELTAGVYFMHIASGKDQRVVKFAKD
jgi:Secretion system C-terminal sorting domain